MQKKIYILILSFISILSLSCHSAEYEYTATNYKSLLEALDKVKKGERIYLQENISIDLSGKPPLEIPEGVTLFGKLGKSKSGHIPTLFSRELKTTPMIRTTGMNVTISNLRITGPDPKRRTEMLKALKAAGQYYSFEFSQGIFSTFNNLTILNSNISGWSHAAIYLKDSVGHKIMKNNIHHNQRWGLGYGVLLDAAEAKIERNYFDWNRHAIAGSGLKGTTYTAQYNVIGTNSSSHAFDMHGKNIPSENLPIAGDYLNISNNTFFLKNFPAIAIRGIPKKGASIYNNCFSHASIEDAILIKYKNSSSAIVNNYLSPNSKCHIIE